MSDIFRMLRTFFAILALFLTINYSKASTISASTSDNNLIIQATSSSGDYQINSQNPQWNFGGSLKSKLKKVSKSQGHDDIGSYQQISFDWKANGIPMSGSIRIYDDKHVILFSQTCNTASKTPPAAFPAFTKLPP